MAKRRGRPRLLTDPVSFSVSLPRKDHELLLTAAARLKLPLVALVREDLEPRLRKLRAVGPSRKVAARS